MWKIQPENTSAVPTHGDRAGKEPMHDLFSRRRFLATAACYAGMPPLLQGCGSGSLKGSSPIVVVPSPEPSGTPTPLPTPTAAPTTPLTIAFAGSSSAEQYLTLYSGPATKSVVTVSQDGIGFSQLAMGAFGKTAGTLINRTLGRPVRFLQGGLGGTTLAQWGASNSPQRAALASSIRAAGGVDAILVQVGRNDVVNLSGLTTETQVALLRSMVAGLRSEGGVPNATIFIGGSQDVLGGTAEQHLQLGCQRLAEIRLVDTDFNVRYGYSTYDLPTFDNVHQTEASQQLSGSRFAAQVIAWLQGTREQRGPQVTGVSFVNQTQTDVELSHAAGTDISPAAGIDGFQIVLSTGIELVISSVERRGLTTVRLTHQPRGTNMVRVAYALDHDISDTACLRDNSAYALPGEPYMSALM